MTGLGLLTQPPKNSGKRTLNLVISILPQAEEKSSALSCFKISQSLLLLRNDILFNCHALERGHPEERGVIT